MTEPAVQQVLYLLVRFSPEGPADAVSTGCASHSALFTPCTDSGQQLTQDN